MTSEKPGSTRHSSLVTRHSLCWDCSTLELADSLLGVAILMGWRSWRAVDGPLGRSHGDSVLDCLIAAEDEMQSRHQFVRTRRLVI